MRRNLLIFAAVAAGAMALPVFAEALTPADWVTNNFNSLGSDAQPANNNLYGAPTADGSGGILATIPTNTNGNWDKSAGGGTGYSAIEHLNADAGSLIGNLSGDTGLSATFSINDTGNSSVPSGATFSSADFAGEKDQNTNSVSSEQVLIYIKSSTASDPGDASYGNTSEWWYSLSVAQVDGLKNGDATTITADLTDLVNWTDINGVKANSSPTEENAFASMLTQVTNVGLSFGSGGSYYSDGFAFSSGNSGSVDLSSFEEIAAVPLPSAAGMGFSIFAVAGIGFLLRKKLRTA